MSAWTDEKSQLCQSLAKSGLSRAQIAERMGISRNAVIGHMARSGRPKPAPYNPTGSYNFQVPERRKNDDHMHLSLLLAAMRERVSA